MIRIRSSLACAALAVCVLPGTPSSGDVITSGRLTATITITDVWEDPTGDPFGRAGVAMVARWRGSNMGGFFEPIENTFGFTSFSAWGPDDIDGLLPRPGDVFGTTTEFEVGVTDHGIHISPHETSMELIFTNETGGLSEYYIEGFLDWDFHLAYDVGGHAREVVEGETSYVGRGTAWSGVHRETINSFSGAVDPDNPSLNLVRGPSPFLLQVGSADTTGLSVSRLLVEFDTGSIIILTPAPGALSVLVLGLICGRRRPQRPCSGGSCMNAQ